MESAGTRRGVALIMALSIILILSIALTKAFESRRKETVLLANSLQRFQSETLSRSVFRAILQTIQVKGLVFVVRNKTFWMNKPFFINEGQYFQIKKIQPIDHLLNLNRVFKEDDPWHVVFKNIVNRKINIEGTQIEKDQTEIDAILSEYNDWIDIDDEPDTEFLMGKEEYYDVDPEFEVKNRNLDRLTEVSIIPAFQSLGFSQVERKENFRVLSPFNAPNSETVDINLIDPDELKTFLELFDEVEKLPNLFDAAESIREILIERDSELQQEGKGENSMDPGLRFKSPLFDRGDSDFEMRLSSSGIKLKSEEAELFDLKTDFIRIEFNVTSQRITVNTEAIVEIAYEKESTLAIKQFTILQYSIN